MAVRDIIFAGIILFTLGISFFVFNFASNKIFDSMIGIGTINQSEHAVAVFQGTQRNAVDRMDYLFFGLLIGLVLGIVITSWFIAGEPLFTFIYICVWVIAIILSSVLAFSWDTIKQQGVFVTEQTISHFPITNQVLQFLPIYIMIIGFLGLVVMFAKPHMVQQ